MHPFYSFSLYRPGPNDNFAADMRYLRGFLPLQDMVERAIIKLQAGEGATVPNITLRQMPYPCYEQDE